MSFMRAAVLANYLEVARQLGVDAHAQLRQVGLSAELIAQPDRLITSEAAVKLIEDTARVSGCDTVGLRMSQPRSMSGFGVVGLLLAQQPTMRDALQVAFRYQHLINESLALRLEEEGEVAQLREEVLTGTPMSTRQATELAVASNLKLFRTLLGPNWAPRSVSFRHPPPQSQEIHQRIFRCRCEFGAEYNAIVFPRSDLDVPNHQADPALGRYAADLIASLPEPEGANIIIYVRRLIHLLLPVGQANIKQVALTMGCSVRKLQLDLGRQGAVFGDLITEARAERAPLYLENPRFDVSQVASLLGYTQPTSFTRWFVKQFGLAPQKWRAKSPRG